jgi:hypothetical protein
MSMKTNLVTLLIVAGRFGGIASCLAQAEAPSPRSETNSAAGAPETSGPRIEFASRVFDFGKISAGESVRHDFVFTNTGRALLEITDVRAGCGCTTAGTWDRQVKPGQTGVIPLQFNSANFNGKVTKSATVTCNDPGKSNVVLEITGTIWKPIDVTPPMVVFKVSDDMQTNDTKVVRIVNHLDKPLTLSDLQCTNRAFKAELKTVKPGNEFELHITAVPPFPTRTINAPVSLKTSSPSMPTINVRAYVMVEQAVMVTPTQITLPAGPLAAAMNRAIMIRNNGTNSLVLSDATVNIPGAEVRVQETQPGRLFNLMVSFPAGFQIKPDQKPEVTLKSNHPRFSLIKVPVFQSQIPAAPARAQRAPSPVRTAPIRPEPPAAAEK